jgi:hypothetical protein
MVEANGLKYKCYGGMDRVAEAFKGCEDSKKVSMENSCNSGENPIDDHYFGFAFFDDDWDSAAKTVRNDSRKGIKGSFFRRFLEANGERYVLRKISRFVDSVWSVVSVPSSVENVGPNCFRECSSLCGIVFESESKLKAIGDCAFSGSGINSIRIPNSVENIGDKCFCKCNSLYEVIFESESKLKAIDDNAFSRSGTKSIRIPRSVENIWAMCFCKCNSLSDVVFESESKLREIGDCAFSESGIKSIEIASKVWSVGEMCFYGCRSLCEVVFESDSKLKRIGRDAFCHSKLNTIKITDQCELLTGKSLIGLDFVTISRGNKFLELRGDFLVGIKENVLVRYFGRSNIVLVENLFEIISDGCFCDCESLCAIVFESNSELKRIGDYAFSGSGIKSIRIPSSVENIGEKCFFDCKGLCEVFFNSDSKLKEIGCEAFCRSGIKSIRITDKVQRIAKNCFLMCRDLCEITFEVSPSIEKGAFDHCPLKCLNVAKGIVLKYNFPASCVINRGEWKRTSNT